MKLVNHETYHIDHSELILLHVIRNLQFYRGASMIISLKKKEDIFATHLIMLGQAYRGEWRWLGFANEWEEETPLSSCSWHYI